MTTVLAEHKRLLFEEERRLTEALSTVRTRLNDLTAVASLPIEILELIFGFCISWLYGHHKPKFRLAWAQVCRRWRSISINSAHLWHCIDLCDPRLANELLIRSKATPISIVSAFPPKSHIDNLQFHAERLQGIDVFLFPNHMVDLFTSIGSSLTNVTQLSLRVPPVSTTFILDIQIPRVTRLSLDCVVAPWDTCRSLTHLSLRRLSAGHSPSIAQLHSIFESSPNLESLRLEDIVPAICPNNIPPTHITPLPLLRVVMISAEAPIIQALLSRIAFPLTTRVQLAYSVIHNMHSLLPHYWNWKPADVNTIRLDQRTVTFLRPGATSWMEKSSDLLFSVTSVWPLGKYVLPGAHLIVDLPNITTLGLGLEALVDIPTEILLDFLTQTVNLESLHILHNDLSDLLRILTPVRTAPVLCPRLNCMTFSMNYPAAVQWWDFNKRWTQPILALAKTRYEHGIAINALVFRRCRGVTAHHFEGIVQEVRVLDC